MITKKDIEHFIKKDTNGYYFERYNYEGCGCFSEIELEREYFKTKNEALLSEIKLLLGTGE